MPGAIDHPAVREQVRLLYIGNGRNLTLAAKTVGIPLARAEKWKQRGQWDLSKDSAAEQISVSESVRSTADSLEARLTEDSNATRVGLSTAARKLAEKAAKLKPSINKDRAQAVRHWAAVASTVHGWEAKGQDSGPDIQILSIGGNVNLGKAG